MIFSKSNRQLNMLSHYYRITHLHLLFFMIVLLGQSCVAHKDLVTMNQDNEISKDLRRGSAVVRSQPIDFVPYRIQAHDQLMIRINAFDGSTEEFINREFSTDNANSQNIEYDPKSMYFISYSVSDSGFIFLPILENVKVTGLTVNELKVKLDEAYKPYLKFAYANVKLANSRITIVGEVTDPGIHYLYNEKNTLMEAIALAGDFTDFSNRKKIKITRETKEGSKSVFINLNRTEFLSTEYYYVQPNDVIYIEPLKAKSFDVSARSVGVVLSSISIVAVVVNLFLK